MSVTWNPSDKSGNITLSGGNLSAAGSGSVFSAVRATTSRTNGKWYWENKVTAVTGAVSVVGIGTAAMSLASFVGNSAASAGIQTGGSTSVNGMTNANAAGVSWAVNDVMNFAVDIDAGKIWLGKNGTWVASGNPSAGTNPWCTFTANTAIFPAWSSSDTANTGTVNFGDSAFSSTPPSGFISYGTALVTVFLTSGTSWTVPSDFTSVNNIIEVIGGGGGGACAGALSNAGGSGGGGGYSKATNVTLTPGSSVNVNVGTAGVGGTTSTQAGTAGGDTWLNATNNRYPTSSDVGCAAKGGSGGVFTSMGGGAGGAASSAWGGAGGTTSNPGSSYAASGGTAANGTSGWASAGAGGAAGPGGGTPAAGAASGTDAGTGSNSAGGGGGGADGGSAGGTGTSGGPGGTGGAGAHSGGSGGNGTFGTAVNSGSDGSEWTATAGGTAGAGGGAGGNGNNGSTGGHGGLYGGGGSGGNILPPSGAGATFGGNGAQGIIVITYVANPVIPNKIFQLNQAIIRAAYW